MNSVGQLFYLYIYMKLVKIKGILYSRVLQINAFHLKKVSCSAFKKFFIL